MNPDTPNTTPPLTIYTIGHSNTQARKIVELLQRYEIKVLVDVRSSPYSQYSPQFNREAFQKTLQDAGITYKYAGDFLGGRPKDPTCYKDGQIPTGHADFLHLVDYPAVMTKDFFQRGIQRLLEIAQADKAAVMCSEEDPANCHRHHLIGRYLTKNGVAVLHIRHDGNLIKDSLLDNHHPKIPPRKINFIHSHPTKQQHFKNKINNDEELRALSDGLVESVTNLTLKNITNKLS